MANYQEVALISCYKEVNTLFQKILHKKFIWDKNASHRVFDQLRCVRQCFDFLVALQLFGDQYNHHIHNQSPQEQILFQILFSFEIFGLKFQFFSANLQVLNSQDLTNAEVHKYTNIQIHKYKSTDKTVTDLQVLKDPDHKTVVANSHRTTDCLLQKQLKDVKNKF